MAITNKKKLYVGGLDRQVTEEILHAAFVPFGPLSFVQISVEYGTNVSKGFGYVEFDDEEDACAAMDNMDESELFGQTLRVTIAKPERVKPGSQIAVWDETDDVTNSASEELQPETKP